MSKRIYIILFVKVILFPLVWIASLTPSNDSLNYSEVDKEMEVKIENLVVKVIEGKKNNIDTKELEEEIDRIVYGLYGLSEEEIRIIEGENLI